MQRMTLMIALVCGYGSALAQDYTIRDLGALPRGNAVYADAINNEGVVAGGAYRLYQNGIVNAPSPFLYIGYLVDLGWFGAASGINDANKVVGRASITLTGNEHAFLFDGQMHDLGTLAGDPFSIATAINRAATIVGYSYGSDTPAHAFMYKDGSLSDIGTLGTDPDALAWAINGSGQIVGQTYSLIGPTQIQRGHSFLYDGTMHDLGALPGDNSSGASGINDSGQVVGSSNFVTPDQSSPGHAYFYDGTMHDLGTLGGQQSSAVAINKQGVIVGMAETSSSGGNDPFVYSNGKMYDLNSLVNESHTGWTHLDEVTAINDAGQIVGSGTNSYGYRAFRLTPIRVALQSLIDLLSGSDSNAGRVTQVANATASYNAHDTLAACAALKGVADEDSGLDGEIATDTREIQVAIACL